MSRILCLSLCLITSLTFAGDWITDFPEAQKLAKKSDKDILVLFTGSTWCPGCIVLEQKVLSKKNFITELKKSFVLMKADFPKAGDPPEAIDELGDKYMVKAFPTFVLMTAEGNDYKNNPDFDVDDPRGIAVGFAKIRTEHLATRPKPRDVAKTVEKPKLSPVPKPGPITEGGSPDDLK